LLRWPGAEKFEKRGSNLPFCLSAIIRFHDGIRVARRLVRHSLTPKAFLRFLVAICPTMFAIEAIATREDEFVEGRCRSL
jgi:hypothetical protein